VVTTDRDGSIAFSPSFGDDLRKGGHGLRAVATTAVSLFDRLLHRSELVVTSGESFRLKESRRKEGVTGRK
jgi:hypothetical protein